MIPQFSLPDLVARDAETQAKLRHACEEIGFMTLTDTPLDAVRVKQVIADYRDFFRQTPEQKAELDMSLTGANRGWGAPHAEQVNPEANPDYKEVFDCGFELAPDDPWAARGLTVYAPNIWPSNLPAFRADVQAYYEDALAVARELLGAIAGAIGEDRAQFAQAFERPMALLRGNFYPQRPASAGAADFGIASHTDYGCLTLLAADGAPGLEVAMPDGQWQAVTVPPGVFVVNFGEMLELWTNRRIKATEHRVVGGSRERISVPMFVNPSYETNVAPPGADDVISAGDHLEGRYRETYVHLQGAE